MKHDVAIIGGGIAGMATAARLQAAGRSTVVLEAHGLVGGCAGFFRRRGFSFDVGATTLVDFEAGGVGGELLHAIGMPAPPSESLPGYLAWLPDRRVALHRDLDAWHTERLTRLGHSPAHLRLWCTLDRLAEVFWGMSRAGAKLPVQSLDDIRCALRALGWRNIPLLRFLRWTIGDLLRLCGLREDKALCGLLGMLVEDTVHSTLDEAPLINAALGVTIRGAGLTRTHGGMGGFWDRFVAHFKSLGGDLRTATPVQSVTGSAGHFTVTTPRGPIFAAQVVGAVPADLFARLAPTLVGERLRPWLERDKNARGGAAVVFLGVPEAQVAGWTFTHHQLMQDYDRPFGCGNNMFVSVSAPGDTQSAPKGHRAVMLSTHCELGKLDKDAIGEHLIECARGVYPDLGRSYVVKEVGTPRTYARFTGRLDGAVAGVRQTLKNSNQHAIPHDIGIEGVHLVGDSTWPGLGTVACVLGSRIAAEGILQWKRSRISTNSARTCSRPRPASAA